MGRVYAWHRAIVGTAGTANHEISFFGPRLSSHLSLRTINEPNDTQTAACASSLLASVFKAASTSRFSREYQDYIGQNNFATVFSNLWPSVYNNQLFAFCTVRGPRSTAVSAPSLRGPCVLGTQKKMAWETRFDSCPVRERFKDKPPLRHRRDSSLRVKSHTENKDPN